MTATRLSEPRPPSHSRPFGMNVGSDWADDPGRTSRRRWQRVLRCLACSREADQMGRCATCGGSVVTELEEAA